MTQKETAQFIEDFTKHNEEKFGYIGGPARKHIENFSKTTRQANHEIIKKLYEKEVLKTPKGTGKRNISLIEVVKNWKNKLK